MWLPNSVMYPDGTFGPKPSDGKSYFVGDKHYVWDDVIGKWVDSFGKCWTPGDEVAKVASEPEKKVSLAKGCECGSWVSGEYARHSAWCPKYQNPDWISVPFDEWKKPR